MSWMVDIGKAINYIEEKITEDIDAEDISRVVGMSPFYFQKGFSLLCGYSVSEYIRNRRLTLAGKELQQTDTKIIDVALKYGYDSPDSFTKAFTRFHGVTPNMVKHQEGEIKMFSPLKINFELKGGFEMDCKIVKKPAFTLVGYSKMIPYEDGYKECPAFWDEHYANGRGQFICGMYGICIDENAPEGTFEYIIADDYVPSKAYPDDTKTFVIKENTWAVFPCVGPMPTALQDVNTKIFKEWLPNNPDYEIAVGYNIEFYTDVTKYPKGNHDEKYYSEIWIPVKTK